MSYLYGLPVKAPGVSEATGQSSEYGERSALGRAMETPYSTVAQGVRRFQPGPPDVGGRSNQPDNPSIFNNPTIQGYSNNQTAHGGYWVQGNTSSGKYPGPGRASLCLSVNILAARVVHGNLALPSG